MKNGLCNLIWKVSVALYLFANGVLGLQNKIPSKGDFYQILQRIGMGSNGLKICVPVLSVIAIIAGILIILELFDIKVPMLETLLLIIAIIWAVFVVVEIISWIKGTVRKDFLEVLKMVAVHLMILVPLLLGSKKFD
jgi:phosphotransferase system  glucose/maltose/N-acetylglucosamine-specific IIC component